MLKFPFLSSKSNEFKPEPLARDMAARHQGERQQFKKVLESIHASRLKDRLKVLDIFLSMETHVTLAELGFVLAATAPELNDRAFLAETLEMFCQSGFAQKQTFETQDTTYEHHHLGMHHDHFICTSCGLIQEFSNPGLEALQLEIARKYNFHPLQHKMEIYGLCANCMDRREPNPPLLMAAIGEEVKIVKLQGGKQMQGRLMAMGLTVGTRIEIISNNPSGPVIVAVGESRLALDMEMATNILVSHSCRHAG